SRHSDGNNPANKYGNVAALLQQINGLPIHCRPLDLISEYNMRRFFMAWALAAGMCGLGMVVAHAQERIGRAAVIRNDVSQISPRVIRISTGDEIFRDETVRTAADSDAKFV